ncbi:unnamed protein product [Lactuca saligna]|uniref:G protein gamma domain-containing protein n=1 Tax=Lactuca saligna TaxID=75948 RepID=A0AA35Z586_LACSI|nr:unnamed protein product [Lactuca saligna]
MGSSPERGGLGSPTPPLPRPKSPPELYGKRRELAKVVMLEREIGFLQEELKSTETLQPASYCIKEVADYVVANPEPLITTGKKTRKSCGFWKWLCGSSCFNMSWLCCCCCCNDCQLQMPRCCCSCSLPDCCSCSLPNAIQVAARNYNHPARISVLAAANVLLSSRVAVSLPNANANARVLNSQNVVPLVLVLVLLVAA